MYKACNFNIGRYGAESRMAVRRDGYCPRALGLRTDTLQLEEIKNHGLVVLACCF